MTIPQVETLLPELAQFISQLVTQHQKDAMNNRRGFDAQVREFFTPNIMDKIERVVPGWSEMAACANQQTLIHITSVLTALHLLPEYKQATSEQQALMEWMVLFHDVAKIAHVSKRDHVHAFRSAAITGKALRQLGFPVTAAYAGLIDSWVTLTHNAVVYRADLQEIVQDNRKLSQIVLGIDRLFGVQAPAGLIVKGVLLHISIVANLDYPNVAPLTDEEVQRYIDTASFPLLKAMMLVDNNGWNLFFPENQQRYRQQTLAAFDKIGALIGLSWLK